MGARRIETIARFWSSNRGASAVEFAVAFPLLLVLMLAGIQVIAYINATRKVEQIATSISEMISQASPPNNSTTVATVSTNDLHYSYDASMVIFPYLLRDADRQNVLWWQDINIDYASIQFVQTSTACNGKTDQSLCYAANVVWTSTTGNQRPCIVPQLPAADTATPSKTTLPRSVFGPGSIITADVVFMFRPTFGSGFVPPLRIARSAYVQPRYATLINLDSAGNDGMATKCVI